MSEADKLRAILNQVKIEVPEQFVKATMLFCEEQKNFNLQIWEAVNALKDAWIQHAKEYQATVADFEKRLNAIEKQSIIEPYQIKKLN